MRLPGSERTRARIGTAILLGAAVLAVFSPVLRNGFVGYDDDVYVARNPHVRDGLGPGGVIWAFTTTRAANWHPLTWLSHLLDERAFGSSAAGHHATSLLLHLANTVLLFLLLDALTRSMAASALVAALFGVHPLHVESVAWIAERKDVLSTLFWILACWAHVRWARSPSAGRYALVVLALVLGLLSKPMLVTLPFALLLLDRWPLERWSCRGARALPPLVREKLPLFAIAFASAIATYAVQRSGHAVGSLEQLPMGVRVANAIVSYGAYLAKTAWPSALAVFYPHPRNAVPALEVAASAAALLAVTLFVVRQEGRRPFLLVGWLWYLGTLVPVIGLVQVGGQARADRYTYVPLIGVFLMLAWGVPELLSSVIRGPGSRRLIPIYVLLPALAVAARVQVGHWKDAVSLSEHAIAVTRNNAVAHANLAAALSARGSADRAIPEFEEAVRIDPRQPEAQSGLALLLAERGRLDEAVSHAEAAIRARPGYAPAHNHLGIALKRLGRPKEAAREFEAAVALDPELAEAWSNLGLESLDEGRDETADSAFRRALRLDPGLKEARNNLGIALLREGRVDEAIAELREAVKTAPGYATAHRNLGRAWAAKGRIEEARAEFEQSLGADPRAAETHQDYGFALAGSGRFDEAIAQYRESLRLDPGYPEAHNNLGAALMEQGRMAEARTEFERAVQFRPGYALAHSNLAVTLYYAGDYGRAWDEVRLARRGGSEPPERFLTMLREKFPEPPPR
ncbi:MAG: tetratricopeptide repeat protein [Acidobacteriia bacterium]|nr:tetratricopeptide repeat protein [Terriglobia bacterium]